MIKTKAGYPVKIVGGSKKSITGKKPFAVEVLYGQEEILKKILNPGYNLGFTKKMFLTRDELVYDNIDELYEALGLKREE